MSRTLLAFTLVTLAVPCGAQDKPPLADILSFEARHTGSTPLGWGASPARSVFLDDKIVHGGHWAVRIERTPDTPNAFSGILRMEPMEFTGKRVELRGFIRTEDVSQFVALWMREDGPSGSLEFSTLQGQNIHGTNDWKEYSISVPFRADAGRLYFGFLLSGAGKAWVDDMRLLVDGTPLWDMPKTPRPPSPLDADHEFDGGSKIHLTQLSPVQTENLATLGRVWGFLKYHHPLIVSGQRHWDYDLFRVLPTVLEAPDRAAGRAAMVKWIAGLGKVAPCERCASLSEAELQLRPDVAWIRSQELLGGELSGMLQQIYRNRPASGKQFYVSQAPGIGNPVFENEPDYKQWALPDAGAQLLALYRFWNIIEYWFPYRDVLGEDWNRVLAEFVPRIALARTAENYQHELIALIARAHDTHANLWGSLQTRPPVGKCELPVVVRFVENQPVVARYLDATTGPATGLKPGDVIERMDGAATSDLVRQWKPYYAASNDAAILRDMARGFTHGACGDTALRVRRGSSTVEVTAKRVDGLPAAAPGVNTHDLAGDTFRRLSDDVAYLKLSSVKVADAGKYIDSAAGTKGLILDIRNYPSEFVVFALGSLLVDRPTPFARFTSGDLSNPGAFHMGEPVSLTPGPAHYSGKVAILVDEVSQSQAEYTAMAFRTAPEASVIGSTTAGADGNVSQIPLPGGLHSMISGIGVFYPDKRPTQRVGILPDVEVRPTIEGIREGRDEVLEAAIRRILGPEVPAATIEKLARGEKNMQ